MERPGVFERIGRLPHKTMVGVIAVGCYFAGVFHNSIEWPFEGTNNGIPGLSAQLPEVTELQQTPAQITYEKTLPVVSNADLPRFLNGEHRRLRNDIDAIEQLGTTALTENHDISWIANLSIRNGWQIDLSPNEEFLRNNNQNDSVEFTIGTLSDLEDGADGQLVSTGGSNPQDPAEKHHQWDIIPPFEKNTALKSVERETEDSDGGFISNDQNIIRLAITVSRKYYTESKLTLTPDNKRVMKPELINTSHIIAHSDIHFNVPWYRGDERVDGIIKRGKQDAVASELPLDEETYKEVLDKALYYRSYLKKRKPIVLVPQKVIRSKADYDFNQDLIRLPEKYAKGTVEDHEFAHALLFEVRGSKSLHPLAQNFGKLFASMTKEASGQPDADSFDNPKLKTCSPDYAYLFRVFDETTYEQELGCSAGHPADLPDELFASAFTVMKFFPDKVLDNINNLPTPKQAVAGKVIDQVIGITDALARRANQKPIFPADSPLRKFKPAVPAVVHVS